MKILGLFLENETVSFAVIERKRKKILLHEVGSCAVKDCSFVHKNYPSAKIGTSLSSSHLLIKQTTLPKAKKNLLEKAISLQAETLSSMDPEETFFLTKMGSQKEKIKITYFFTKKSHINDLLSSWRHLGFDPDSLSAAPQALIRFCKSLFSELKDALILHLGKRETTLVHMKNHLLQDALSMDFSCIDLKEEDNNSHPINDILSAIHSFKLDKPLPLMITGYQNSSFTHALEQALVETVSYIIPSKGKLAQWGKFAVAIGSALDAVSKDDHSIQYRIGPFHSSKSLKNIGKAVIGYYLLAFATGYFIFTQFSSWRDSEEEKLLNICKAAIHQESGLIERSSDIDYGQPLECLLEDWEERLTQENKPFRYPLTLPTVQEIFFYLNQPPFLFSENIKLKDFSYDLIEHPTVDAPFKSYIGKVTIRCNFPALEDAKKLEQRFKKAPFIDPKKDVEYTQEGSSHSYTFYLRQKK